MNHSILTPFKMKRLQAANLLLPLKMETQLGTFTYIFQLQIETGVLRN